MQQGFQRNSSNSFINPNVLLILHRKTNVPTIQFVLIWKRVVSSLSYHTEDFFALITFLFMSSIPLLVWCASILIDDSRSSSYRTTNEVEGDFLGFCFFLLQEHLQCKKQFRNAKLFV
jgi:hypothetical protein